MMTAETGGSGDPSFAQLMTNFWKLSELESKISAVIGTSKVPWSETRKFLKGKNVEEIQNTPLCQFHRDLFHEIGLGELKLNASHKFGYTFEVSGSPVCDLFPDIKDKMVCEPTVDAFSRFFKEDLDLGNNVDETGCRNVGHETCRFKVSLEPLQVYLIALDHTDKLILLETFGTGIDLRTIVKRIDMTKDELLFRLTNMIDLGVLDDDYQLTPSGGALRKYLIENSYTKEEEFDPPWTTFQQLTSAIAATQSFAEALIEVTDEDKLPWEADDSEIIDLKEKAKDKAGFGELLSAITKQEDEDDSDDDNEDNED